MAKRRTPEQELADAAIAYEKGQMRMARAKDPNIDSLLMLIKDIDRTMVLVPFSEDQQLTLRVALDMLDTEIKARVARALER